MTNFAAKFAGIATLALAALPVVALSTAHAQGAERIHVSDLNLATAAGKAVFVQRVDHAARRFCRDERDLDLRAACEAGVRTEASERASARVQMASRI